MLIRSSIAAIALAVAAGAAGTEAIAGEGVVDAAARSEQITYSDLDLGTRAGQAALTRRIRAAGNRVCDIGGMQTTEDFASWGRCYRAAVSDGLRQLDQVLAARSSGTPVAASTLVISAVGGN